MEEDERGHHRQIPDHGRGVRHEEAAVTVEDSEAPRGEHQKSGTRKQDSGEPHRQVSLLTGEAVGDDRDKPRRREHSE